MKTKLVVEITVEHQIPGNAFKIINRALDFPGIEQVILVEEFRIADKNTVADENKCT